MRAKVRLSLMALCWLFSHRDYFSLGHSMFFLIIIYPNYHQVQTFFLDDQIIAIFKTPNILSWDLILITIFPLIAKDALVIGTHIMGTLYYTYWIQFAFYVNYGGKCYAYQIMFMDYIFLEGGILVVKPSAVLLSGFFFVCSKAIR